MNNLTKRDLRPFTGLIENFFEDPVFAPNLRAFRGSEQTFVPAVDLAQTDEGYLVTADLPGLDKKDIHLSIENNTLTLSGERAFERKEDGPQFDRIERAYGKFSRTFQLPSNVDNSRVKASFENGVLSIEVPKAEEAKSRQIEIG